MSPAISDRSRGRSRRRAGYAAASVLALAGLGSFIFSAGGAFAAEPADNSADTATPIKHVVVIFDENISFDHYFGTYPDAENNEGETPFTAAAGTPTPNNYVSHPELLTDNPNSVSPTRLTPDQAVTCSQNHNYVPEQQAFDGGAMDEFPEFTQAASGCATSANKQYDASVMDFYDGNTVTGMWNYAQNYTMSDNSWDTVFGPSTPGALNLISGQTHGATAVDSVTGAPVSGTTTVSSPDADGVGTINGDPDPFFDDCSDNSHTTTSALAKVEGKNIGDLLNDKGVTWGWFQGGFDPTTPWDGTAGHFANCQGTTHSTIAGVPAVDYSPHHSPFEYYESTSNPHHLAPASDDEIGHNGQANHNYDLTRFDTALETGNVPAVSFLKAAQFQDGHAGYSNPIDEQHFVVNEINAIQSSDIWPSTAIVIAYDDSDGWYDHVAPTILNGSDDPAVQTAGDQPLCSDVTAIAGGYADRCGPGPRIPMMLISPFTTPNTISHDPVEQTSVLKFIEDNWQTGRVGDASFDERAGAIDGMFDFDDPQQRAVLLNQDGTVDQIVDVDVPVPGGTPTPEPSTSAGSTPTPAATAGGKELAATGFEAGGIAAGALLLVAAGVVVWFVRRRKTA
ncbi:phospholipase C [Compostimonas suwonensis]|uniref:Phospholipase C n=1 Tax=Compostimonas suwonensis TaxID=1048394 RepID=A0A2M9C520_9MICO|nr:alkaline phosphatase family protein [Compostimonas suwonensis]PJJ65567.1 phospholipase C [Compostimonas suwonensis]